MRDKTLLQAFILGLGQVSAKIISLIFLFRLSNDLGSNMSLYALAYVPFSLFADLACLGLIPGTSKLVSKLLGENKESKVYSLLKKGSIYCLFLGIIFFLFMLFFSNQILSISLFENYNINDFKIIKSNLLLASLSLILLPIIHFYKGYLQGHLIMYPSSISIIIENIIKLLLYRTLIKYKNNYSLIHIVFIIYFISYFISFLILFLNIFKFYEKKNDKDFNILLLIKTCIFFGISTMLFTIYQFIDSITLPVLYNKEGYYTAYMFETIRLIFFPIIIAQAIGGILNPKINYMFKEDKVLQAKKLAVKCSSLIIYILIPFMIIIRYFAEDIYNLFYYQENGSIILYHISVLIIFFGIHKVLIGISLGLPKANYIIVSTVLSAIAKYILNYILIPKFAYLGAIYATIIAVSICILASYYVLHMEGIKLFIKNMKDLIISFITVFISLFIVIIFRVCFSLNDYPEYYSIILYSILIFGIYYILLKIIKQSYRLCIK